MQNEEIQAVFEELEKYVGTISINIKRRNA